MVELLRSNNQVVISLADALLTEAGVVHHVADQHMSATEGSIGAIQARVLVADNQLDFARRLLTDHGLDEYLFHT